MRGLAGIGARWGAVTAGFLVLGAFFGASPSATAAAEPCYRFETLPVPDGYLGAQADAINEEGLIVGLVIPHLAELHAAYWDQTGVHEIDSFGGPGGEALSVNNAGQIVGWANPPLPDPKKPITRGFLFDHGTLTQLTIPAGVSRMALGINDAGSIVGLADKDDGTYRSVLWQGDGETEIAEPLTLPGLMINNHGLVAGNAGGYNWHPFLWQNGERTDLPLPDGIVGAYVVDLNDNDEVLIIGANQTGWRYAYRWDGAAWHAVGTDDRLITTAVMNNHGQVVGTAAPLGVFLPRLTLWDAEGAHDLTDATACTGGIPPEWRLDIASGINDRGEIVGRVHDEQGFDHAYLLAPVQ